MGDMGCAQQPIAAAARAKWELVAVRRTAIGLFGGSLLEARLPAPSSRPKTSRSPSQHGTMPGLLTADGYHPGDSDLLLKQMLLQRTLYPPWFMAGLARHHEHVDAGQEESSGSLRFSCALVSVDESSVPDDARHSELVQGLGSRRWGVENNRLASRRYARRGKERPWQLDQFN
jgi:hypothetical protein